MPTPEEIFMQGFTAANEPEMPILEKLAKSLGLDEEPEMPILAKLAENLGLTEEDEDDEVVEMPVLQKLAENLGLTEEDEEVDPEFDLSGMTDLEKLAFTKWAAKSGFMSRVKGGIDTLKGKGVASAKQKVEAAKAEKPRSFRLFSKRKKAKNIAAAEKNLSAAKSKRLRLGAKTALGGGAALLTAAAIKKAIGGRKKD